MAVTVTDDFTTVDAAESATGWSTSGGGTVATIALFAQGTLSISLDPNGTGVKAIGFLAATQNITDKHVFIWMTPGTNEVAVFASGGYRIRVTGNAAISGGTNYGEWNVGGNDKALGSTKGVWLMFAADAHRGFDAVNGTVPALAASFGFAAVLNVTVVPSGINSLLFIDKIAYGTKFTVTGGAAVPRGSIEVAANDNTNGRGAFKSLGGLYYVLSGVTIGDTAAASVFEDNRRVWNFEDQPVSATFYKVVFVGDATGVGAVTRAWQVDATPGPDSFVEQTTAFNNATADDVTPFPATENINDYFAIGYAEKFRRVRITAGATLGSGGTVAWEYWNGTAWTALANVSDGTASFTASGTQTITYDMPENWATRSLNNTTSLFYIRARITTAYTTTNPVFTQGFIGSNRATFGIKSGTGTAADGAGGNTFTAGGIFPFRLEAIDSNIAVGLYGCVFTNSADLRSDALRAFMFLDASAVTWTDQTRQAGNTTTADMSFMPATEATDGDYAAFGHDQTFSQLRITLSTAGTVGVVAWEYWNGSAWAALTSLKDGTDNFRSAAGTYLVTFAIPDDWTTTTLNSRGPFYYIRARVTTLYTVNPVGTQALCDMGGGARFEHANVEVIRSTFTNMDTIRIRNGALFKKCIIANSVATPSSAALDLGATDPTANTVRDLQISNCARGILLRPTGTATFNFRAITFSNNAVVSAAIQEDNSLASFVDLTLASNNSTVSDVGFFPTIGGANNDAFYIGYQTLFDKVEINVGTAGTGAYTVTWQYWSGAAWTTIPALGKTDGTNSFKNAGTNYLTFIIPPNWAKTTVNSQGPFYFVRALRDAGGETIQPLGTQMFAGYDVRLDAPSAATVTINVLESGTTPKVENVNGSTIVINNSVNITITVKDKNTNAIQDAQTAVYRSDNNLELMNQDTNASGIATTTFNYTADTAIYVRVRKSSAAATKYVPVSTTGTITSSGFSLLVTLETDAIVT